VFILNNRWDATAYEDPEKTEQVRKQHMECNTKFLYDELKVCNEQEAKNRIYFVSAREVLLTRTQTNPQLPPSFQSRILEFEWFETAFEKCISMSAVKTKFEQPSQKGCIMADSLQKTLDALLNRAIDLKDLNEANLKEVIGKIDRVERQLIEFTQDIKDKIRHVMDDVEKNVSLSLNEEIKRIYDLIDQYERPFHPEEHQLNWYKKELHKFVEQKLGYNLSTKLNAALLQNLDLTQKEIRCKIYTF
jgi:mitofusin 2